MVRRTKRLRILRRSSRGRDACCPTPPGNIVLGERCGWNLPLHRFFFHRDHLCKWLNPPPRGKQPALSPDSRKEAGFSFGRTRLKSPAGLVTTAAITAGDRHRRHRRIHDAGYGCRRHHRRTIFPRTRHVDRRGATVELLTVQRVNRLWASSALLMVTKPNHADGRSCGPSSGWLRRPCRARRTRPTNRFQWCVEGKISDKQFCAHVMLYCPRLTLLSPDCSRPPGFKSSPNVVHYEDLP